MMITMMRFGVDYNDVDYNDDDCDDEVQCLTCTEDLSLEFLHPITHLTTVFDFGHGDENHVDGIDDDDGHDGEYDDDYNDDDVDEDDDDDGDNSDLMKMTMNTKLVMIIMKL